MRILFLSWRDTQHPQGGGSERYIERVAQFLSLAGHDVTIRTAAYEGAPRHSYLNKIQHYRAGNRFSVYPRALISLLIQRYKGTLPDIIVDTQNGIPFFSPLVLGKHKRKDIILLTHHCHREQWSVAGPVLSRIGWFLESVISPRVYRGNQYITVSQASARDLINLGVSPEHISIIHNGVDRFDGEVVESPAGENKEDHSAQFSCDSSVIHLVTLSRLVPHKQIEHAIDSVATLYKELGIPIVLDIIGSGWWEEELKEYARKRDAPVIFHGFVNENHKNQLLYHAGIHLMPSRKEGWGLAVMEAALHRVPTIGYHESAGLCDSIIHGQTGMLVHSYEEFLEAIRILILNDSLRIKLGDGAYQYAQNFSWDKTGKELLRLITKMTGDKKSI